MFRVLIGVAALFLVDCSADGGQTTSTAGRPAALRSLINLGQRDVVHVDRRSSRDVELSQATSQRRLVVVLPAGQCGRPRIEPTRERRTGDMDPQRLSLHLVRVACPNGADRALGG